MHEQFGKSRLTFVGGVEANVVPGGCALHGDHDPDDVPILLVHHIFPADLQVHACSHSDAPDEGALVEDFVYVCPNGKFLIDFYISWLCEDGPGPDIISDSGAYELAVKANKFLSAARTGVVSDNQE